MRTLKLESPMTASNKAFESESSWIRGRSAVAAMEAFQRTCRGEASVLAGVTQWSVHTFAAGWAKPATAAFAARSKSCSDLVMLAAEPPDNEPRMR